MGEAVGSRDPLDIVAQKIATHAKKADDQVIAAAMLLREARRRVEAGEAGKVTWYSWAPKNIPLKESRLGDLQRIAKAEDPWKELERLRKLGRDRAELYRDRKKKKVTEQRELEEDRLQLIAWAKRAPLEKVRKILSLASGKTDKSSHLAPIATSSVVRLSSTPQMRDRESRKTATGL